VKRLGMGASFFFVLPLLLLQLIVFVFSDIDFSKLQAEHNIFGTSDALEDAPVAISALALSIGVGIWRLLLLVILQSTKEAQETSPFAHTLLVCGPQWWKNREVPEGWDDGRPVLPGRGSNRSTRDNYGGGEGDAGSDAGSGAGEQQYYEDDVEGAYGAEGYGAEGYPNDFYTVTNTSASTDYPEDQQPTQDALEPQDLLEATCGQRALFITPDGFKGIFVALPTAEDQPVPFLFVRAYDVRPIKRRFGGGSKQVSVTFNSVEVGGLDVDFIQQNVYNDPESAWQQLQALEDGEYAYDEGGAEWQETVPEEELPVADEQLMTPRTLAAQRL